MLFVVPIVLGAIALTCTVLTVVESPHLQGLTTIAISSAGSIGATVYATRTLAIVYAALSDSRYIPSTHALFRHFNHWAAAALPIISDALDELAPHSGPLFLVAANELSSSPTLTPYVSKVRVWFGSGPHDYIFDPVLWFEWQPIYQGDGSIFCGNDGFYLTITRLCHRLPPRALPVRSLDVYRYDIKALIVYGEIPPTPALCIPGDLSYPHRPDTRPISMPVFGQQVRIMTTMNRVISIQPSLPVALFHSGSGAVVSLDVYRPDMKNLAVYGQATPLHRCIYTELSRTLLRVISVLAAIYRRGIAILINLCPSRAQLILACTLAFIGVCTQAIRTLRCHGLSDTEAVESSALAPNQRPYVLVLDDNQPKESQWWSIVPRFPSEVPYGQYDRDQGPEDDVSQMLASDSHGASMDLVTSNHQTSFVTTSASGASGLSLTISTGPGVWIPSRSDDCGGQLSEYSASSTTLASCHDTIPADSPVADTPSPILTGNNLCGTEVTVEPQPTPNHEVEDHTNEPSPKPGVSTGSTPGPSVDQNVSLLPVDMSLDSVLDSAGQATTETVTADNLDITGALEEPSIQDTTGHVGAGTDGYLDELRMLPGNQPIDTSTVDKLLADGSNVDVDTSADMSPSSEALVELGHVKQESLADELARVGPTEGEYVDSGLTIATLLEELTHSDMDNPDASTPENNSARLPNPSQVVAPAPADHIQHNFSLNVSVDMSLETDAGNEDTPVDTPKTDGDEVDVSAGDEAGHTTTAPDSSSLSSFPSVSSSEMITNERADAFFADMTTDSFIGAREGLSAITEEDSGQVAPTAVELLAEESLDLTTDNSLGSQLLDVDLAVLGDSANSLDSDLDGPAARKVESRLDWADDNDLGRLEPMYDPPLIASAHTSAHAPAPSPAPLASSLALATATEVNPSEDRPERLRTTGLETSSRQKRPTLKPNDLHKLLVSNNRHNAARSGRAPPFVAASPSLPLFSSPSSPARLPIPSASDVATSRDQDEQKVGDSSTKTSQKRRKKNKSTPRQQAAHKTPVKGSSKSTWAPVGEDATGEGAPGEDDTGEGAPGEDDTGEGDTGEKARPKKRKRRSPANLRNRQQRHEEFIQKKQEEEQNRK